MKHCLLPTRGAFALFLLFLAAQNLSAQKYLDINVAHNWNYLDRDISVSAEKSWGKIGLDLGINYFQHTVLDASSWEQTYAANAGQKIGFHAAFLYHIALHDSHVELSPFFKVTAFKIGERQQVDYGTVYQRPAFFKTNTALGVQAKTQLAGRLYLFGSVEAGARWDDTASINGFGKGLAFNGLNTGGSVGLAWRFRK